VNFFDLPVLSALLAAATAALAVLGTVVTPAGAIVLVTVAVRALLIPVGISMARAERGRRRLAPRLAELQKRWRRDPERLRRETLALYAAEKVSPFAGCLPALAQAPVLTLVYAAFASPTVAGAPNALLGTTVFGAPLGRHLSDLAAGIAPSDLVFAVLIAALIVVAVLARRASTRVAALAPAPGAAADGQAALVARIAGIAPFLTVVAALFIPLAATLYLTVSSAWSLGERALLRRYVTNIG
jgi:YidC/Oxa1 family membrane protein insertase